MNSAERVRKPGGSPVGFLCVDSSQLQSDIAFIRANRIENLMLLSTEGYNLPHIDWLAEVAEYVRDLVITPPEDCDFSYDGLKHCTGLVKLQVNNYSRRKNAIDLSANGRLESLSVHDCRYVFGMEVLSCLKNLVLNSPPDRLLTTDVFASLSSLNYLCLAHRSLPDGLSFLATSPIESLLLCYCRKISVAGISNLGLRTLEFANCRNVLHSDEIFDLHELRTLKLVDSFRMDGIDKVLKLKHLEVLVVVGKSYFEDGNLDAAKGRFRHFGFDNKRHYNLTFEEYKTRYRKC